MTLEKHNFNPRSHEGSDVRQVFDKSQNDNFNPRSHEGSDTPTAQWVLCSWISIHAPTKGATVPNLYIIQVSNISIHAPTKGATKLEDKKTSCKLFQSTLPRRERLPISNERSRKITFQSTLPRRERQSRAYQYCLWAIISIHAPTKGATRDIAAFDAYLRDFNPRSHEGSDLTQPCLAVMPEMISIHAPTKGATFHVDTHVIF